MSQPERPSPKILVETAPPVTTIIINRPQVKNALDNEAARALAAALKAFEADSEARVAVLTGAGGGFCAGADLKELGSGTDYFPWAGSDEGPLRAPLAKPVIAAIEGHACAGGLGVALFCDIRIVDDTATFGVFSRRWGVPMSDGTTVRLPRIVGQGRAAELLFTGRTLPGEEAERWGFLNRVVEPEALQAEAAALAAALADGPAFANDMTKRMIEMEWAMGVAEAIEAEAVAQALCMTTEDFRRAYEAFAAKRKPVFEGN